MANEHKSSSTAETEILKELRNPQSISSSASDVSPISPELARKAAGQSADPNATVIVSPGTSDTVILRPDGTPAETGNAAGEGPVVAWLVVTGGPGKGNFRTVQYGNNTVGRSPNQRISLDFGDEAISSEEQAYIRYDAGNRRFLFVPNMAKPNVVSVNGAEPTSAVELMPGDVIVMGQTQLRFVPFCGPGFDWDDVADQ